jgi:regulator of protease activity HflC (stomatin/prohibitin superfamily)
MAVPVIGALVAVPLIASSLFRRVHVSKDLKEAHDSLNRVAFGKIGFGPHLLVKEGGIAAGKNGPAGRVGGPASLIVYNDSAVVTEQGGCLKRVVGPGFTELEPFEKVWETIDLRPQRWVHEVFGLTKEGIPVSCEADVTFKIDDGTRDGYGQGATRSSDTVPYPYTAGAVFKAATSKWIREPDRDDRFITWAGRVVVGFAESTLRNILAEYRLDWLLAPPQSDQPHPRDEICQRLRDELEGRVSAVGAKLLAVGIGNIQVKARDEEVSKRLSDIISEQWLEAWQADWRAQALTRGAEGEAELLRMDTARIQAQAEMVITLTEGLQSTVLSRRATEPYLLALRFVEALRWMSYDPDTRDFMPPEAMRTLRRLQRLLEEGTLEQEGEGV